MVLTLSLDKTLKPCSSTIIYVQLSNNFSMGINKTYQMKKMTPIREKGGIYPAWEAKSRAQVQLITFDPQAVKQYIQQSLLEKELLYFGYEAFGITFVDPVSE